jgi:ligand-binding sensor domain-containing protein
LAIVISDKEFAKQFIFKMLKKIFLSTFIILLSFASEGQELYFKQLTVNDGLTQHDVSCILQDTYGFIWIGTYDGLNRYDGFNVLNFSHKTNDIESLSSDRILCLFEDSKKRIWIGTDGGGLNYYSLITERFVRVETPKGFDKIDDIAENSKGEIYFATSGGLLKTTKKDEASVDILQLPVTGLKITGIALQNRDNLFFSTNQGIWTLENNHCKQIQGTENSYCSKLIIDKSGNILSIMNGKLKVLKRLQYSYKIEEIDSLPAINNGVLCESKDGTIWFGSDNKGLFSLSPKNYTVIQNIKYNALENMGLLSNTTYFGLVTVKDFVLLIFHKRGLSTFLLTI